mmetsp:Transcript_46828/g.70754  ORF Transcript_46828/g.70754 Transcript_46828/m.70754 type:complete len:201 (+) Transcript_46828:142-744(+)
MKLLFSTIIISSFLNCALADSFNFEHIGQSPRGSDVPTSRNVGYSITYTNKWTAQNHPFRYPSSDPHYSSFLWASHSSDYVMWENGGTATRGIENVAEIGSIGALRGEVQAEQNMGNVLDDVVGSMIGTAFDGATSISNEDLCVDASHPYVSGLGMLAPRYVMIFIAIHTFSMEALSQTNVSMYCFHLSLSLSSFSFFYQ